MTELGEQGHNMQTSQYGTCKAGYLTIVMGTGNTHCVRFLELDRRERTSRFIGEIQQDPEKEPCPEN